MKNTFFLAIFLSLISIQHGYCLHPVPAPVTVNQTRQWVEEHFGKGKLPPFSFVYGGQKSDNFIRSWDYKAEKLPVSLPEEQNQEKYLYSYTDRNTGLVVKCAVTCFTDFPAVEWVLHFINTSGSNTPVIEKAAAIDWSISTDKNNPVILHHSRGTDARRTDFEPLSTVLKNGENVYMTPTYGRSSSDTAFPFFNIELQGQTSMLVAIGWTGKWYADIKKINEKTLSLKSGMEKMQLKLYPKEEIRTPRICLFFWQDEDRMAGHNGFRQFVLKHHSRKINGELATPPVSGSFSFGDPYPSQEYECLTEKYALALVKRHKQFEIVPEIFWLDAGWYEGCGWNKENGRWRYNVGNWSPEKERFPNGLRPIADAIHEIGAKFMVWFEPERVSENTYIHREHPEWLLRPEAHKTMSPYFQCFLFNLGNEKARLWLTDYISDIIRKEGIDYYRQDFNFDPYPYWKDADKPGRVGIPEIRHIEGLYAYWDSLLVRFPNLMIDNCAGGGRRIDLETISRSTPLWRTDYEYGEPVGSQCHTYALNFYLPMHGTGLNIQDDFHFRSTLGVTGVSSWVVGNNGEKSLIANREYMAKFKELQPYFYGDYYPLTFYENYTWDNVWLAYQMNRPQEKDGIIVAFRRAESEEESINIKLSGLDRNQFYELDYEDYGVKKRYKGSELVDGFDITILEKPASLLIKYKQVK